jgi:predicted esterase
LDDIEKCIKDLDIDVLLGFSQGANVVDTYLTHRPAHSVKRAVIMSGYSLEGTLETPIEAPIDIQMLGVISEQDEVVLSTLNPSGNYVKSDVLFHDKGHKIPTRNPQIRKILVFMEKGD